MPHHLIEKVREEWKVHLLLCSYYYIMSRYSSTTTGI